MNGYYVAFAVLFWVSFFGKLYVRRRGLAPQGDRERRGPGRFNSMGYR